MEGKYLTTRLCCILACIFFWNVENYFDWFDGGFSSSDKEFSSFGAKHWTKKKFADKACNIGKTLLWAGTPPIVGLAEVENGFVLKRTCESAVLYKKGYRYVHRESHDPRGIDVALMYLPDSFMVVSSRNIPILMQESGDTLKTRDILHVEMKRLSDGETWHFFVNHHPSKYGGKSSSGRLAAMRTLVHHMDSLIRSGEENVLAMGDFNDCPDGEAFSLTGNNMVNLGLGLMKTNQGSIRYHGHWQLIDNFIVSTTLAGKMKMEILRPPFLLERDRQWPGDKPKRCYIGPRYNAGVSDHLPILLSEVNEFR